jgi:hypothetical protein
MDDIRGVTTPESESESSESSEDSEEDDVDEKKVEEVKKHDFKLLTKKLAKVGRILEQFIEEHGQAKASKRKDYKSYLAKQQVYLEQLEETDERKQEVANGRAQEAAKAEQKKIEEDRLAAVAAERNDQKTELENAKAEALAKLRAGRAAREEREKAVADGRKAARKAADDEAMKLWRANEEETAKRGAEFMDSLKDQEDRGMITLTPRSSN